MKTISSLKLAVAALALLGTASLAVPSQAAVALSAAARSSFATVAAAPTAEQKAIIADIQLVAPGSLTALLNALKTSPDTATLATTVETLTLTNPSLMALYERLVASFAADPRLAKLTGGAACAAEAANTHSLVRIWCGLPALETYPVVP